MLAIHQPVLMDEVLSALQITPSGIYIDGTFGQGGHTTQLLSKLGHTGRVIAIDKDPTSAAYVTQRFFKEEKLKFCYGSFSHIKEIVEKNNLFQKVNGILLDLGTSATQLDTPERGFSFLREGPLDMRMNPAQGEPAAYWVARLSAKELALIFEQYGEERWAERIAEAIISSRKVKAIQTTIQLAHIVKEAHPRWPRKIHPATRVFQALRIYVNREIEELKQCLKQSMDILAPNGRLAVITFHSLEAREVKQFMRKKTNNADLPHTMQWVSTGIKPTLEEVSTNPRSRSAILRVMEKI